MSTTLDTLPAPVAPRLRRPSWRDPRLLVGVALVAGSVALGATVVASADRTAPAYVAAHALTPGDAVTAADLRSVDVNLAGTTDAYLSPAEPLEPGAVVVRVVREGELVARSALGRAEDLEVRQVAVPVESALSDRVVTGSTVDLWSVPPADANEGPSELVRGVDVAQVDTASSGLVGRGGAAVHVLVPSDRLADVLEALASEGTVAVVPGDAS